MLVLKAGRCDRVYTPEKRKGSDKKVSIKLSYLLSRNCVEEAGVTVIWASTRLRHPHSQKPSDVGIPCNPNQNR